MLSHLTIYSIDSTAEKTKATPKETLKVLIFLFTLNNNDHKAQVGRGLEKEMKMKIK